MRDGREGVSHYYSHATALQLFQASFLSDGLPQAGDAVSQEGVGCTPVAYAVKQGSRTAFLFLSLMRDALMLKRSLLGANAVDSGSAAPFAGDDELVMRLERAPDVVRDVAFVWQMVLVELWRAHVFSQLKEDLYRASGRGGVAQEAGSRDKAALHDATESETPLLTVHELEELPARWVVSSMGGKGGNEEACYPLSDSREGVTALDAGATVQIISQQSHHPSAVDSSVEDTATTLPKLFRVHAVSRLCRGEYWVDVLPLAPAEGEEGGKVQRVDRDALRLHPPAPLYLDPLVPCDEMQEAHGGSKCVFLAFLLRTGGKGAGARQRRRQHVEDDDVAMKKSLEMSKAAQQRRRELHAYKEMATAHLTSKLRGEGLSLSLPSLLPDGEGDDAGWRLMLHIKDGDCLALQLERGGGDDGDGAGSLFPDSTNQTGGVVEVLYREVEKLARQWDFCTTTTWSTAQLSHSIDNHSQNSDSDVPITLKNKSRPATPADSSAADEVMSAAAALERDFSSLHFDGRSGDSPPFAATHLFYYHLFLMLRRYQSFLGDKGYNQGPQAAVPPAVLRELQLQFETRTECFASPLNAYSGHKHFCSLFPDVDVPFGSLGSFFDLQLFSGHFEVNPPFDALVLRKMCRNLLDALEASDRRGHAASSLLFVVVLPSHDPDEGEQRHASRKRERPPLESGGEAHSLPVLGGAATPRGQVSVERQLRESRFCLAHNICPARDAAYVDGHQHLLRVPLFCIQTPTRLIVLGNCAARQRYSPSDAATRLDKVRSTWREWTAATRGAG